MTTSTNRPPAAQSGEHTLPDGRRLARLGLGVMQLPGPGVWGPPKNKDAALTVLRRAVELGVNHIDTSHLYGPHVANELIKEALYPYTPDLLIATKIGVIRGEYGSWDPAAKPAELRNQIEENLQKLGQDRLDLVYLRVGGDGLLFPADTPFEESFGTLAELHAKGLIRHLGLSGVTPDQLAQAQAIAPIAAVQNRYNLFDRSSAAVLAACERDGIAFVPYFPLAAGLLKQDWEDKPEIPPEMAITEQQSKVITASSEQHQATAAQVALAWLLGRSPMILAIPGTTSPAHLEQNIAAAGISLTEAEIAELDSIAG